MSVYRATVLIAAESEEEAKKRIPLDETGGDVFVSIKKEWNDDPFKCPKCGGTEIDILESGQAVCATEDCEYVAGSAEDVAEATQAAYEKWDRESTLEAVEKEKADRKATLEAEAREEEEEKKHQEGMKRMGQRIREEEEEARHEQEMAGAASDADAEAQEAAERQQEEERREQ